MKNIKLNGMYKLSFASMLCLASTCSYAEMHCIPGNGGVIGERCTSTQDKPGKEPTGPIIGGGGGGGGNNSGGDGGGGGEDAPHNNRNEPKPEQEKEDKETCIQKSKISFFSCRGRAYDREDESIRNNCGLMPSSVTIGAQIGPGNGSITMEAWSMCAKPIYRNTTMDINDCEHKQAIDDLMCMQ